ncbi:MAG: glycosyltransferase [Thermovirgaceae bacterium]
MKTKISIIVPVYNDPEGLKDTLESLVAQDFPRSGFEIVVVDNGSTDNTHELAESFSALHPNIVKVAIEARFRTSYAARNKGIRSSSGEILCFIDANMTVDSDWLNKVSELFSSEAVDAVGFHVKIMRENGSGITSLYNKVTGFPVKRYIERAGFAPTCCLAVRHSVIEQVGPFDWRLMSSGDVEFGHRLTGSGFSLHYEASIVMYHPARETFASLTKKYVRIGRGLRQLRVFYPERYKPSYFMKRNQLPLNPMEFTEWVRNTPEAAKHWIGMTILLYCIAWLTKFIKIFGYFKEALKPKRLPQLGTE